MIFNIIHIKNEKTPNITPVQFGYENCKKSHSYGPAVRTYWLIHYVVSGTGIFKIKDKTYKLKPGEMFVIPPYEETYYEADCDNPWSYIWIGFTIDGELPIPLNDIIYLPEGKSIFNSMKDCVEYSSGQKAYLCARIWDLIALMYKKETDRYDYIEKAIAYIHSEYMHFITVDEIAERLNLDRTYFSVIFKKKTGMSPKQYPINYRMEIAKSILDRKKYSNISGSIIGWI